MVRNPDRFGVDEMRHFYSFHGAMTDPGEFAHALAGLPTGAADLCRALQGLVVHVFWAGRYGLQLDDARKAEVNLRWARDQIARILELDQSPLNRPRPLERRLVGNCRDFAVLFCAAMRQHGVPARARCGFATYFHPGQYEDHWVAEYWSAGPGRWVTVDPQLDQLQVERLRIDFNPADLPPGHFVTGGEAWRMCREGVADPEAFGIFDLRGLWFVQGDLIRDFLSLNKVEILPWDAWGSLMTGPGPGERPATATGAADLTMLDAVAALARGVDDGDNWRTLRDRFERDPGFAARPLWWRG